MDFAGYVFTTNDPSAGAGAWSSSKLSPSFSASALSCVSISLCVAVNSAGTGLYSTSPAAGAGSWQRESIGASGREGGGVGARSLDAISCASLSLCLAGDWGGDLIALAAPTAGDGAWSETSFLGKTPADGDSAVARIATGGFTWPTVGPIACGSPSMCVAIGEAGLFTSSDPGGGAAAWKLSSANLARGAYGLDCPTASFCVGLQPSEVVSTDAPLAGKEWQSEGEVDPARSIRDISCPSVSLCVVVDARGDVIAGRVKPATRAQIRALLRSGMVPRGGAARFEALLRERKLVLPFDAPTQGRIRVRWLLDRRSTRSAGHLVKTIVIARGAGDVPQGGSATIALSLTKDGAESLEHRKHVRLIAEATFSAPHASPVRATAPLTLER